MILGEKKSIKIELFEFKLEFGLKLIWNGVLASSNMEKMVGRNWVKQEEGEEGGHRTPEHLY